jgi:hypothetical protein
MMELPIEFDLQNGVTVYLKPVGFDSKNGRGRGVCQRGFYKRKVSLDKGPMTRLE